MSRGAPHHLQQIHQQQQNATQMQQQQPLQDCGTPPLTPPLELFHPLVTLTLKLTLASGEGCGSKVRLSHRAEERWDPQGPIW